MSKCIAAIDQGTTSTRCMLFDAAANVLGVGQAEHEQIYPKPGWVEHDASAIWQRTQWVVAEAMSAAGVTGGDIAAVGITNQRETTVVWDRRTGEPVCNAIVWQDTRTKAMCDRLAAEGDAGIDRFRAATGLPLATYFSGPKIAWVLENVDGARARAENGDVIAGTIDAWLVWNLTGGVDGGRHVTDVTNASRTMLMDLRTLRWDAEIAATMGVPVTMLPTIVPSSSAGAYGVTRADGPFGAVIPIAAAVGDQQAALIGQCCFEPGEAKNTYGTGCFMLLNTGEQPNVSEHGLLTTVAYRFGDAPPVYALEGSIAIAGALVQWLRDNLGLIATSGEIEALAKRVDDAAGVYFVPAFSGLFAPHWRSDARGVIVGLTRAVNKAHIARAALEATAYQTREVIDAMRADSGVELTELKVDGGMVVNELLMQFQSDVLGVPVTRPVISETTALGAAFAAGLAVGYFAGLDELRATWRAQQTWRPAIDASTRESLCAGWRKAVQRSLDWVE
ncbi:MAG: glycerol kinase GlpK [Phycisphaera sp.]|nr:glycerol kinase GlpK [Phycisphaera sp.]